MDASAGGRLPIEWSSSPASPTIDRTTMRWHAGLLLNAVVGVVALYHGDRHRV